MSNTCGFGHHKDGQFNSICLKGKTLVDNKRNINGRDATLRNLNLRRDAEVCGNLRVKGVISQGAINTISASDINNASATSTAGYVINTPGIYKLIENVNWTVTTSESYAITIASDCVTLDLCGYKITQLNCDLATNYAIHVLQNLEQIRIQNGEFNLLSGGMVIVDPGVQCITIDSLKANKCGYLGQVVVSTPLDPRPYNSVVTAEGIASIFLNGKDTNLIKNVVITNCHACHYGYLGTLPVYFKGSITSNILTLTEEPLYPLTNGYDLKGDSVPAGVKILSQTGALTYQVSTTPNVAEETMRVCDPNGKLESNGYNYGIFGAWYTDNFTSKNIIVDDMFGDATMYGFTIVSSKNIHCSDFNVNDLKTFGLTKGWLHLWSDNAVYEHGVVNKLISNAVGRFVSPGLNFFRNGAEGCKIDAGDTVILRRIDWNECIVQTQVPTTQPTFFTDAVGVIAPALYGVDLKHLLIEDCTATNIRSDGAGNPNTFIPLSAGYLITVATPDNINDLDYQLINPQLINCKATNIVSTAPPVGPPYLPGISAGVFDSTSTAPGAIQANFNGIYKGCIIKDIEAPVAWGISTRGENAVLENNIITNINGSIAGYGIQIAGFSGNAIVRDNTINNSSTFGIQNDSGNDNHIVISNKVKNTPVGYSGLNTNVPISTWNYLSSPIPVTGNATSSLTNWNIRMI